MVASEQQLPCLLQPKLFLILEGTEAGYRHKMAIQTGATHSACIAERLDAQSCPVVVPYPPTARRSVPRRLLAQGGCMIGHRDGKPHAMPIADAHAR